MSEDPLVDAFEERLGEIRDYLEFLDTLETVARSGPPKLQGAGKAISTQQQRMLYSSVYLQLYNLVEATVTGCLDRVSQVALGAAPWKPGDLSPELRREWVRVAARTHEAEMSKETRLNYALEFCQHLVTTLPVGGFKIERGSGNWSDKEIEAIAQRLGLQLHVTTEIWKRVKRPIRDDKGPLKLVVKLRNDLAHGAISFAQCGDSVVVSDLRDLTDAAADYLREVIAAFVTFVHGHGYLVPERRPDAA